MVKITVSYTDRKELKKVLQILNPLILRAKVAKEPKGVYKKAYIDLNL